ncbi:glycosyltransferase family 2 protein [Synechococcus sp. A10-1-5-9]|uniref:glycosyltransferase family 2 protein n=1 Tax=Synechococcus sp. A10-1-5-9 TaxID=3392295 RepID=UPI0039E90638
MPSATPSVSVVVPMRDATPWLPSLLAALVHDWDTGFELVVVDDGSKDGSADLVCRLCAHWPTERWQLLEGKGEGVSSARNQGIMASRADVIAFLDADDRPFAGRLSKPLHHLASNPHLSHVHGGWWRCNAQGERQQPVRPWDEGAGFSWHQFMEHKAVLPSAWTVRRSALLQVGGFNPALRHSEDVDLILRLAAAGHQGDWIHEPLVRYRIHSGNASGRLEPQLKGLLSVIDHHLNTLPNPQVGWAKDQRYSTATWATWQAWQAGNSSLALQLLKGAMASCPYPLVRRPVHLIEAMHRSSMRIGAPFNREHLLASAFWRQAESMLLQR